MPVLLAAALICAHPIVHDGDSLRCGAERIRIANIDAPELPDSPKCEGWKRRSPWSWCDFAAGKRSRDALRGLVKQGPVKIMRSGVDRYGRTLATISVNGQDAGEWLIARGLARRWQ